MSHFVGMVPAYANENGDIEVDADELEVESGRLGDRFLARRQRRLGNRMARLDSRMARRAELPEASDADDAVPIADAYQAAATAGLLVENQINGLGDETIAGSNVGALDDTLNRNFWAKSLVLDSDAPQVVLVTGITIAGLPVNVGAKGSPLSMYLRDSTRFGISFGRRMIQVGQVFRVTFENIDTSPHIVSGGLIGDELNPYSAQAWMESLLIKGAINGFTVPGIY